MNPFQLETELEALRTALEREREWAVQWQRRAAALEVALRHSYAMAVTPARREPEPERQP